MFAAYFDNTMYNIKDKLQELQANYYYTSIAGIHGEPPTAIMAGNMENLLIVTYYCKLL